MIRRIAVIPARLGSKRLPEKPLVMIGDKPLLQLVWENAGKLKNIDKVVIATDSGIIAEKAGLFGAECMVTPLELMSGSDRVYYVCSRFYPDASIVVNIQGDEPFINTQFIDYIIEEAENGTAGLYSAYFPIMPEDADDISNVKVVLNRNGEALYFSRSPVPYNADVFNKHLGIYVWKMEMLKEFHGWQPTMLEKTEKLEQLRVLEMGRIIRLFQSPSDSLGIDTPEDLQKARSMIVNEN